MLGMFYRKILHFWNTSLLQENTNYLKELIAGRSLCSQDDIKLQKHHQKERKSRNKSETDIKGDLRAENSSISKNLQLLRHSGKKLDIVVYEDPLKKNINEILNPYFFRGNTKVATKGNEWVDCNSWNPVNFSKHPKKTEAKRRKSEENRRISQTFFNLHKRALNFKKRFSVPRKSRNIPKNRSYMFENEEDLTEEQQENVDKLAASNFRRLGEKERTKHRNKKIKILRMPEIYLEKKTPRKSVMKFSFPEIEYRTWKKCKLNKADPELGKKSCQQTVENFVPKWICSKNCGEKKVYVKSKETQKCQSENFLWKKDLNLDISNEKANIAALKHMFSKCHYNREREKPKIEEKKKIPPVEFMNFVNADYQADKKIFKRSMGVPTGAWKKQAYPVKVKVNRYHWLEGCSEKKYYGLDSHNNSRKQFAKSKISTDGYNYRNYSSNNRKVLEKNYEMKMEECRQIVKRNVRFH